MAQQVKPQSYNSGTNQVFFPQPSKSKPTQTMRAEMCVHLLEEGKKGDTAAAHIRKTNCKRRLITWRHVISNSITGFAMR